MWDCIDSSAPRPSASLPRVPASASARPASAASVPPRPVGSTSASRRSPPRIDGAPGSAIAEPAHPAGSPAQVRFPVGWLTVIEGPGSGTCFALEDGVSQIGRGADSAIALNFGDTTISLQSHASIAYDTETHAFHVAHGGTKGLVCLNDRPVLATETLDSFDLIRIGETTLVFVALCSPDFHWDMALPLGGDTGGPA